MATPAAFTRLVRFVPKSNPARILIGQPVQKDLDVGIAVRKGRDVMVNVFSGSSVLAPGAETRATETIGRILSPLAQNEVGTIRCIGLNYKQHAAEVKMDLPSIPTIFMKPSTSLGDPWPAPTILPKLTQLDDCGDYESELAVVIAANDISSRTSQLSQSQWSFSKGFDGACPIGPTLVSTSAIPDPSRLHIRGHKKGKVLQDCGTDDLIFSIPKLISFLSQSTTLPAGTIIITGTPAGVGMAKKPKETLGDGDEFAVEILPHIGTLVNVFQNEQ